MAPTLTTIDSYKTAIERKHARALAHFSIRTLLVAVGIVSIWMAAQVNWLRNRRLAIEKYDTSSKQVTASSGEIDVFGTGQLYRVAAFQFQSSAPFRLNWFGESGLGGVYLKRDAGDDEVGYVRGLFPEAEVSRR